MIECKCVILTHGLTDVQIAFIVHKIWLGKSWKRITKACSHLYIELLVKENERS